MLDEKYIADSWDRLNKTINADTSAPEEAKEFFNQFSILMKDIHLRLVKISGE